MQLKLTYVRLYLTWNDVVKCLLRNINISNKEILKHVLFFKFSKHVDVLKTEIKNLIIACFLC